MIELKLNELYILEGRIYRLVWSKWNNGGKQGNRAILKLLDYNETNKLLVDLMKDREGGLK
jgi:hypothetical protein